jgi:hypothetical protein
MNRLDENDVKNKEQDDRLDGIDDDINDHEDRISY